MTTESDVFDPLTAFDDNEVRVTPPATLERLRDLANKMTELESEVADKTAALAEVQGELARISERTIPDVMAELQMLTFTLEDGSKIEIKPSIKASITAERKPVAHRWLREHNFDGIIKTKVLAEFGKGDLAKAEAAKAALANLGYDATLDESVHASTLTAFVKERLEAGDAIPADVFGIFEGKKTKITSPKKKSAKSSKIAPVASFSEPRPQVSEQF